MSTSTSTTNPDWFFSSLGAGTGLSAWKYEGLNRQVYFNIHNNGHISIGGATDSSYRSANSKLTLNASYSGGDTGGFCMNATDQASDPNRYNLRLFPYVQGDGQVAYCFRTYNASNYYDALNIGYNGSIGIGTNNPTTLLDINPGHPSISSSNNYLRVRVAGGTYCGISLTEHSWHGHTIRYNQHTDSLEFCTQDNTPAFINRMALTIDGKLGIGTTTPNQALHVVGNINFTGTLFQNGSPFQTSQWTTEGDDSIIYDGFVGVGVNGEPLDELHIGAGNDTLRIGAEDFEGSAENTTTYGLERSRNQIVFAGYRDMVSDKIGAKMVAINKQTYTAGNPSDMHLIQSTDLVFFTCPPNTTDTDNTVERLRILDTGNIGIGMSAPTAGLHIDRGAANSIAFRLSSSSAGWGSGFVIDNQTVSTGRSWAQYVGSDGIYRITDYTAGLDRMAFTSDGNVGIGTLSPTTALQITRSFTTDGDYSAMISFENTSSGYYEWRIGPHIIGGQAMFSIRGGTDGFGGHSNLLNINGNGNVGIGVIPNTKFHVGGDFRVDGSWYWAPGTNIYGDATANGQEWSIDLRNQNTYTGCFWHVWSDKMGAMLQVHGDTGNVGIGLAGAAPGAKFEVRGTSLLNATHFVNTGAFANGGYVSIQPEGVGRTGYVEFRNSDTSRMAYIGYGDGTQFNFSVDQARNLVFFTSGVDRFSLSKEGYIYINGRMVIQNAVDGGSSRGIWYWTATDSNWASYMAASGSGRSIADGTACTGAYGFSSHAIRYRVHTSSQTGFIWENQNESCLMSIRGDGAGGGVLGKWGVGTVSPGALLHLYGSGNYLTSIHVDADDGAGILLNSTRGDGGRQWSIISTKTGYGIGPGNFGIYDVTGGFYRLMINQSGQVGINQASAGFTLDVNGTIHCVNELYVGNNNNGTTSLYFGGPYGDAAYDHGVIECRNYSGGENTEMLLFKGNDIAGPSGPDRIRMRASAIAFDTYPGGTTDRTSENIRMYIDQNGLVGIGTASPGHLVHWYGNADGGVEQYGQNISSGGSAYTLLGLRNNTGSQLVMFLNASTRSGDGGGNVGTLRNDIGVLRLASAASEVQLWTSNVNRMTVQAGGNIIMYNSLTMYRKHITFSDSVADMNHAIFNDYNNISGWGAWDGMRMNVFNGLQIRVGNWTNNDVLFEMHSDRKIYSRGPHLFTDWVRPSGNCGVHFESYGRGIWAPDSAGNPYGNVATYGTGRNGWSGYAIHNWYQFMSNYDNWGIHNNIDGRWMIYGDRTYVDLRWANDVKFQTLSNGTRTYGRAHANELYCYGQAYSEGWWRNYGIHGLYNETYGCHFYPNTEQYGNWRIHGNEIGGWGGLRFTQSGTDMTLMMGNWNQACGIHLAGVGWAFHSDVGRNFYVPGDITAYWSDRRLKENFQPIPNIKEKLQSLTGYFFNWNEKGKKIMGPREYDLEIGLIAQDVQAILPQAVKVNKAGRSVEADNDPHHIDYLTIQYDKIVVLLVEGYKQLQKEVDELRSRCEILEKASDQ